MIGQVIHDESELKAGNLYLNSIHEVIAVDHIDKASGLIFYFYLDRPEKYDLGSIDWAVEYWRKIV